jgi:hypothetical protein
MTESTMKKEEPSQGETSVVAVSETRKHKDFFIQWVFIETLLYDRPMLAVKGHRGMASLLPWGTVDPRGSHEANMLEWVK